LGQIFVVRLADLLENKNYIEMVQGEDILKTLFLGVESRFYLTDRNKEL
jgi:hypothetical protein